MKSVKRVFLAILIAGVFSGTLGAADLINKDNEIRTVTAIYGTAVYGGNENPVPVEFKMVPGFEYKYICGSCTITMEGGSKVQVTETDVVVIQGGKLIVEE